MGILEELYYGNLAPCEPEGLLKRTDYRVATERATRSRDALEQMLNEEQKIAFADFITDWDKMSSIVEEEIFKTGFRLGMGIMSEAIIG